MTAAGLVAALSVILLYFAYLLNLVVPKFSMLLVLSLLPVMLAYERTYTTAALCFAASALLSWLLFPITDIWMLYVAFFGWYGIVREFIVTKLKRVWAWAVLAVFFNAAFFVLYFFFTQLFANIALPRVLLIPAAEAAFVLFEIFFGLCRAYYISRIRKLVFRG
jgi:hypothetical protein